MQIKETLDDTSCECPYNATLVIMFFNKFIISVNAIVSDRHTLSCHDVRLFSIIP